MYGISGFRNLEISRNALYYTRFPDFNRFLGFLLADFKAFVFLEISTVGVHSNVLPR